MRPSKWISLFQKYIARVLIKFSHPARFKAMIVEFSQLCNYIVYVARLRGCYTQEEYNLVIEYQHHIEECNQQIAKHGTMTILDGISLLIDGLSILNKK